MNSIQLPHVLLCTKVLIGLKEASHVIIHRAGYHSYSLLNTLNAELNPIRHLLALVGARHIVHVSRIRVNYHRCVINANPTLWLYIQSSISEYLYPEDQWLIFRQALKLLTSHSGIWMWFTVMCQISRNKSIRIQIHKVLYRKSYLNWQFERPRRIWEDNNNNNNTLNLDIILRGS